jgi:hypothetical protein
MQSGRGFGALQWEICKSTNNGIPTKRCAARRLKPGFISSRGGCFLLGKSHLEAAAEE